MNEKEEAMHTPGPWKATRSDPAEGVDCWWITAGSGNAEKEICSVPGGYRSIEANAALIAAAPALYDTESKLCAEVSGLLDLYEEGMRALMGNTNFNVLKLRYDEARTALKQARGEP